MEGKKQLRRRMIQRRKELLPADRKEKDAAVAKAVMTRDEYKKAGTLFCFAGCRGEVSTEALIKDALAQGKAVGLPRVEGRKIRFYRIQSRDDLEESSLGIPEPKEGCPLLLKADLIVMPGVAFDAEKNRLGYGGGYYDRYLKDYRDRFGCWPDTVAIAYEEQLVQQIPAEETDIRPRRIITDRQII